MMNNSISLSINFFKKRQTTLTVSFFNEKDATFCVKTVTFRIRLLHFTLKVITDILVLYHIFCYISRYKCLALFCTFCGATKLTFLLDFISHGSNEEESFMDHPKGTQNI